MNAVGIDVSKGKSMVCVMRPFGEVVLEPITIGLGPDMVASHIPFQLVPKLQ